MAQTDAERAAAYRRRKRRDKQRAAHSAYSQTVIDELNKERELTQGEQLLVQEIARTKYELDELEAQLRGETPEWLRAAIDELGVGEISLNVDNWHAVIDRKRSTLARLLSELRQYGVAAAKASSARSAAPPVIPTPDGATTADRPTGDDDYRDLFAVG